MYMSHFFFNLCLQQRKPFSNFLLRIALMQSWNQSHCLIIKMLNIPGLPNKKYKTEYLEKNNKVRYSKILYDKQKN